MSYQFFSNSSHRRLADLVAHRQRRSAGKHNFADIIGRWFARSRQRRHLAELAHWDDHLLKDIGLSREAALREAAKPFWQS